MRRLRRQIYHKLTPDEKSDRVSRAIDLVLIALIAVNVAAVMLETVDAVAEQYKGLFWNIEAISVTIFTIEYAARVWTCVEDPRFKDRAHPRFSYIASPMAIIDLLAILPFYLSVLFQVDLRFLRVLRLTRILKLTRYSSAMSMLFEVFRDEADAFLAGLFILIVLLILAASGAYLAEHEVQPEKFGSIPAAMWWAMATLTTVGYGDVTPITPVGQLFGSLVAIVGVGIAALPAGILASGMADRLRRTREELAERFRAALEDNVIDLNEEAEIEALRRDLGVAKRVAAEIRADILRARQAPTGAHCPHCGKSLR